VGRSLIVIFSWALFATFASLVCAENITFGTEFTTDFEQEDHLRGWTPHEVAFQNQPTHGDNPSAGQRGEPSNHQGEWWIGTFERYQGGPGELACTIEGDEPTGWLQSDEFTIQAGSLTFLVGGGAAFETRVELIVLNEDGDVEFRENRAFYASGRNEETMRKVTWNLDRYRDEQGFIRIVDNSSGPWGHINADDFRFIPRLSPPNGTNGSGTVGSGTVGSGTDEPDTVGSDTVGSDTVGSDTVVSDTVGSGLALLDLAQMSLTLLDLTLLDLTLLDLTLLDLTLMSLALTGLTLMSLALTGLALMSLALTGLTLMSLILMSLALMSLALTGLTLMSLALTGLTLMSLILMSLALTGLTLMSLALMSLALTGLTLTGLTLMSYVTLMTRTTS